MGTSHDGDFKSLEPHNGEYQYILLSCLDAEVTVQVRDGTGFGGLHLDMDPRQGKAIDIGDAPRYRGLWGKLHVPGMHPFHKARGKQKEDDHEQGSPSPAVR